MSCICFINSYFFIITISIYYFFDYSLIILLLLYFHTFIYIREDKDCYIIHKTVLKEQVFGILYSYWSVYIILSPIFKAFRLITLQHAFISQNFLMNIYQIKMICRPKHPYTFQLYGLLV